MSPIAMNDDATADQFLASLPPFASKAAPDLFSLAGKECIVTGGARGLGLCIAASLLDAGAPHVHCLDILPTPDAAEWALAQKVASKHGGKMAYHRVDITNEVEVEQVFARIYDESEHPVAGFFAAAGIQQMISALEYPIKDFRRIMEVNVTGLQCLAYNTSKAALLQMCRSAAAEWGTFGIRVNTLSPGYIRTAMTDALLATRPDLEKEWLSGSLLERLATPDEFRGPALFLLSDASSFMTGADLLIDGGHCAT